MQISPSFMRAFAVVGSLAAGTVARAATISTSPTAPVGSIVTSQLVDLGPGAQDGARDYTDNGGPPGQTFTVTAPALVNAVTVLGNGDAGSYSTGTFDIQIGSVNTATGQITQLARESAPAAGATSDSQFITFHLAAPVAVNPGTTYAFSILGSTDWYGFAHGTGDDYAGGQAFNNDLTTTSAGNADPRRAFNGFVSPNPAGYDYVFAVQGTAIPEPTAVGLICLAAGGLLVRRRR
jgi:hypothetical protein